MNSTIKFRLSGEKVIQYLFTFYDEKIFHAIEILEFFLHHFFPSRKSSPDLSNAISSVFFFCELNQICLK